LWVAPGTGPGRRRAVVGFTAAPSRKPVPPDGAPASRGLAEEILAFLVALG